MVAANANKTIARNTVFLYVRMLVVLVVTLYTSRIILEALGIDDYGLYQAVGGIVGFLSFISNALATATSRFITFALGKGNNNELQKTFATTFTTHILIGLLIVFLAETVGLWYVYNKMVIPEERFSAAVIIYHISILTAFMSIMQVPFNAEVIAHEKMSMFAYVGIVEAVGKLGIVYLLALGNFDRLIFYAILLFIVHAGIFFYYVWYCRKRFVEVSFKICFDKKLFKEIFGFSGWSLLAGGGIALSNHGILLLLNLFFAPGVVAARAISLQVNSTATQFVSNFRTAANPQIIKRYAVGDKDGSKRLLLESTKFSYYLMLLIAMPLFFLSEPLLNIWLVEVPDYTVVFLQIVVVQSLFQVFDTSFYVALFAKGRIRENALLSPTIIILCFPVVYILFRSGASPLALSWAYLIGYAILGMIIKPILVNKIVEYKWNEILGVFRDCFMVTVAAFPIPLFLFLRLGVSSKVNSISIFLASILFTSLSIWTIGLTKDMRERLLLAVRNRIESWKVK